MMELKCRDSYNWLLHLYYVRGEYDYLERLLNNLQMRSGYSWYLKGLIALRNCSVQEALKNFDKIASSSSSHVIQDIHHIKAVSRCLLLLGKHHQVIELIRETGLKHCSGDWQLWFMLGDCYLHCGNIPLAKEAFQHAIQNSTQLEPFLQLANCYLIEEDYKNAILVLRKANE